MLRMSNKALLNWNKFSEGIELMDSDWLINMPVLIRTLILKIGVPCKNYINIKTNINNHEPLKTGQLSYLVH